MGANLLITVLLGAVFVALVLWVAVRLRGPRRRDERLQADVSPRETRSTEPQPAPRPEQSPPAPPIAAQPPPAAPPTPVPEIEAADFAAGQPVASPDPVPEALTDEQIVETAPPESTAPPAPEPAAVEPPAQEPAAKVEATRARAPVEKRPRKKRAAPAARRQPPGTAAVVHEAFRHIRTWTTSLTPGRALPAILTDARVDRGEPTTYRFKLKQNPYSIVKTDLTEDNGGGAGPLLHEKVQLLDGEGRTLFEMSLLTSDIGSDETPGEITAYREGPWLDDFRELNAQYSKDSKRIGTDFRKKFRAKEQVRLKRDFGV